MEDSVAETFEEIATRQEKELRKLKSRITSLIATDKDTEIMKLKDINFGHEQRIDMLTEEKHQMGEQLRYNTKLLSNIRKALGVNMNTEIVDAINKLKGI